VAKFLKDGGFLWRVEHYTGRVIKRIYLTVKLEVSWYFNSTCSTVCAQCSHLDKQSNFMIV
jgi:hypothetical protein